MSSKRYVLIDGLALAYRSFYGVKHNLSTKDGVPTNALYGFIRAMDQLRERWNPTHWQVIFDGGIPAYRRALVPEYKAQRKPMPDELRQQLDPIQEYLEAAGVAWLRMDGEEADDVMASLARQADEDAAEVLIATSDKDELQMVNERISIVSTVKDSVRMTPEEVQRKTGVRPDQVVDWLALVGDAADNIPGVAGVGPVTAAAWLQTYGSVDGMYEHLDELTPQRFRQILLLGRERLEVNRRMVRLNTELACPLDWNAAQVSGGTGTNLIAFYRQYELNSLVKGMTQPDLFAL